MFVCVTNCYHKYAVHRAYVVLIITGVYLSELCYSCGVSPACLSSYNILSLCYYYVIVCVYAVIYACEDHIICSVSLVMVIGVATHYQSPCASK